MWKPATLARMYCWTARVIVLGPNYSVSNEEGGDDARLDGPP